MRKATMMKLRAAIVLIAPVVVLAGWIYHPYIGFGPDTEALAEAVAADTTRWGISHLLLAVGFGLLILGYLAVISHLREAGERRWSAIALPLIVFGSAMWIILPGMEFAPLAAAGTGADVQAAQDDLMPWFLPILISINVFWVIGIIALALGVSRSRILTPGRTRFVVGALLLMIVSRIVPLGAANYLESVALVAALWPLAFRMLEGPSIQSVREARPAST